MSEASSFALEEGDFIEKASSYDEAFSGASVLIGLFKEPSKINRFWHVTSYVYVIWSSERDVASAQWSAN